MVVWVEGQGRSGAPSKSLHCRRAGRGSGRARGGRAQRVGGGRPRSPGDWRVACVGATPSDIGILDGGPCASAPGFVQRVPRGAPRGRPPAPGRRRWARPYLCLALGVTRFVSSGRLLGGVGSGGQGTGAAPGELGPVALAARLAQTPDVLLLACSSCSDNTDDASWPRSWC